MELIQIVAYIAVFIVIILDIYIFVWRGVFLGALFDKKNREKYKKLHDKMFWGKVILSFAGFIFLIILTFMLIFRQYAEMKGGA